MAAQRLPHSSGHWHHLRLTATDVGKSIKLRITGAKGGYKNTIRESAAVQSRYRYPRHRHPENRRAAKVGKKLTARAGTWTSGTTLKYQWYRSGKAIKGAKSKTYTLVAADRADRITVKVTGTKAGYAAAAKTSAKTGKVAAGTLKSVKPKISGTAKVGKKLKAKAGTWTSGTKLKYRWYRSGKAIKGASSKTYKVVAADRGDRISVKVTGTKAGYTTPSKDFVQDTESLSSRCHGLFGDRRVTAPWACPDTLWTRTAAGLNSRTSSLHKQRTIQRGSPIVQTTAHQSWS